MVNAHWACYDNHNFGDWLTPYIIKKLTGALPNHTLTGQRYMLAGSILQEADDATAVLGAGFGARDQVCKGKPTLHIVRGQITGAMLVAQGFTPDWLYGDPGIVLPLIYNPTIPKTYAHGILPHYVDYELFKTYQKSGVLVIDITQPIEAVINAMLSCETLATSSLHGLIVGDAYGIPTTLEKYSDKIAGDGMKYTDYRETPTNPKAVLATIKQHIQCK